MKPSLAALVPLVLFWPLWAQGTRTKVAPAEYPVYKELPRVTLAAENLGHNIPTDRGAVFTRDYIAIDVAVFAADKGSLTFSAGQFDLSINRKPAVLPQTSGMVAASLKYDDWTDRPRMSGSGGLGGVDVILGEPVPSARFPGDTTGRRSRLPGPPRVETNDPNVPNQQPVSIEDLVQRASLPSGETLVAPFSGVLFFPYQGKLAKIKSLELRYSGTYGDAVLRLR